MIRFSFFGMFQKSSKAFKRMFWNVLAGFLFVIVILCLIFSFSTYRNAQEQTRDTYQRELIQVDKALSERMALIQYSMLNTVSDPSVIQCVLQMPEDDFDELSACISTLQRGIRETPYLLDLVCYPVGGETVYSGSQGVSSIGASGMQELIETHLEEGNLSYEADKVYWLSFREIDGTLYYICDFLYSGDRTLGLLLGKIDPYIFDDSIGMLIAADEALQISSQGHLVYTGGTPLAKPLRVQRELTLFGLDLEYQYSSALVFHQAFEGVVYRLPALFLLLLGALLGTLFVSMRLYAPLRQLVERVQSAQEDGAEDQAVLDEYSYISHALEQSTNSLRAFVPRIMENICRQILNMNADQDGEGLVFSEITQLLDSWGNPTFLVYVLALRKEDYTELTVTEAEVFVFTLRNHLAETWSDTCMVIPHGGEFLVLTPRAGDQPEQTLQRQLKAFAAAEHLQIDLVGGEVLTSIRELPAVFRQQVAQLQKKRYDRLSEDEESNALYNQISQDVAESFRILDVQGSRETVSSLNHVFEKLLAVKLSETRRQECMACFFAAVRVHLESHGIRAEELAREEETLSAHPQAAKWQYEYFYHLDEVLGQRNLSGDNRYMTRIKELVAENYGDPNLSLGMLAEQLNLHPSYLSSLFVQKMGESLSDYLSRYRIEKAKKALDCSDVLIRDISSQVGFNSIQTFNRTFKKWTGITPQQYRHGLDGGERL